MSAHSIPTFPHPHITTMKNIILAPTLLLFASCASIMNGGGYKSVEVTSTPLGARFTADAAGVAGVTPAVVDLPNGRPVTFRFELEGYEPQQHVAKARMSSWVVGNILFGGILGFVIDAVNSGSRVHRDVQVNLLPIAPAAVEVDA